MILKSFCIKVLLNFIIIKQQPKSYDLLMLIKLIKFYVPQEDVLVHNDTTMNRQHPNTQYIGRTYTIQRQKKLKTRSTNIFERWANKSSFVILVFYRSNNVLHFSIVVSCPIQFFANFKMSIVIFGRCISIYDTRMISHTLRQITYQVFCVRYVDI